MQFVRRHRHDFKDATWQYTSLCSANVEESCYERNLSLLNSMEVQGITMKCFFRNDAVPIRDTVVSPGPGELSERRKRQVRFESNSIDGPELKLHGVIVCFFPWFHGFLNGLSILLFFFFLFCFFFNQ